MPQPVFYRDKSILFDDVEVQPGETVTSEILRIEKAKDLSIQLTGDDNSTSVLAYLRTKPESDESFGLKGAVIGEPDGQDLTFDEENTFNEDYEVKNYRFMEFRVKNLGNETITINAKAFSIDTEVTDV